MKRREIKFIVKAVRWFDRVNGNTYHSVRITRVKDSAEIVGQFQYGYGENYKQTALAEMEGAKWLPKKYRGHYANGSPLNYTYERENNYPILWIVLDGLQRECIDNGTK